MGLLAAAIGALYSVYATYGLARGLKSADMTFLRTSVAGILTLPVLVYYLRFIAAGSMWAGFGVVMRKFRLDPILATTAAGVFGLAADVPFYLATEGIRSARARRWISPRH
jgi:hypothetical protein